LGVLAEGGVMVSDKNAGRALVLDLIERAAIAIFFSAMAWSFLVSWQQNGNLVSLILLLSESSVVLFIVIRRSTGDVSVRPIDWLVAVLGTTAPLLVRPTGGGEALASLYICVPLMLTGLALQIAAKLTLRRSFGVVAANRGLKVTGPYRLVRHPMYAGYLMTQIAFLLTNPSAWNLAVYSFAMALQIGRIMAEEQVLASDPSYRAFAAAVPHRLVPRVF
jgi:protein-S-isoprenylcysteine O-methyltransferase Ste14